MRYGLALLDVTDEPAVRVLLLNGTATGAAMRRNVERYPWYVAATSVSPWLPIFFLFFSERVGFDGALTLSAVYYGAVVMLEVPSGYLSDRVGRRPTLIVAAAAFLLAYSGFLFANSLVALALCQALLAAGMAFRSGSDSALLHDSLAALGRESEYGAAEAHASTVSMIATGISCLAGGVLGSLSLAWPYALAAPVAAAGLMIATGFVEPPVDRREAASVVRQTRRVLQSLADPVLAWLLSYYVLAFSLAHIPFEFYQPWIRLLGESGEGAWIAAGSRTPLLSGVVFAVSMFGGAVGAFWSIRLAARLGLPQILLLANLVQVVIIAGLALALHPLLLVLVLGRNFAMAMGTPPMRAAIAARVGSAQLATWLSVQSLAGRLGFSIVLFMLARTVNATLDWPSLRAVLVGCASIGLLLAVLSWWFGHRSGADTGRAAPATRP